jgi:hypothetical protein
MSVNIASDGRNRTLQYSTLRDCGGERREGPDRKPPVSQWAVQQGAVGITGPVSGRGGLGGPPAALPGSVNYDNAL